MDVTRFLIRTKSTMVLNESFSLEVNEYVYGIKLVEDMHGLKQIVIPQDSKKVDVLDESSEEEDEWGGGAWSSGDSMGRKDEEYTKEMEHFMTDQSNQVVESTDYSSIGGIDGTMVVESVEKAAHLEDCENSETLGVKKEIFIMLGKSTLNAKADGDRVHPRSTKVDGDGGGTRQGGSLVALMGHQQESDPISYSNLGFIGPTYGNGNSRKKSLIDIYESIKFPYAPSYFTVLL